MNVHHVHRVCNALTQSKKEDVRGIVKWFNVNHGYGFITTESNQDVFVHANACSGGFLYSGESVSFQVEPSPRGSGTGVQASNVVRCSSAGACPTVISMAVQSTTFVC